MDHPADPPADPRPALDPGSAYGPTAGPARWRRFLDDAGAAEARRARARARWLRRQAEESATFAGVLVDLAERGARVALTSRTDRTRVGTLAAVGADVVDLRTDDGRRALVRLSAVAAVRAAPGEPSTIGDRAVTPATTFHELVSWLVEDRPDVRIRSGSTEVRGRLWRLGLDVVTVRSDGMPPAEEHVALAAMDELVVAGDRAG